MSANNIGNSPKWHRRPEARPEEILEAAAQVFMEQGYAATKLEEVARRAGVSKGTLYLYFDSKEALFKEMVRARLVVGVAAAEERFAQHTGTARQALEELIRAWWQSLDKSGMCRLSQLVTSEMHKFPELGKFYHDEVTRRARRLVGAIIERGVARGEFRAVPYDYGTRGLPGLVLHALQTLSFFTQFDPTIPSREQVLEGILDLYFNGLLARPGEGAA